MHEPEELEQIHRRHLAEQIEGALLTARSWLSSKHTTERDRRYLEDVIPALMRCVSELAAGQAITAALCHRVSASMYIVGALAGSESRGRVVQQEMRDARGQRVRDGLYDTPEQQTILQVSQQVLDEIGGGYGPWKGYYPLAKEICRRLAEHHGIIRDEKEFGSRLKRLLHDGKRIKAPPSWGPCPEK